MDRLWSDRDGLRRSRIVGFADIDRDVPIFGELESANSRGHNRAHPALPATSTGRRWGRRRNVQNLFLAVLSAAATLTGPEYS